MIVEHVVDMRMQKNGLILFCAQIGFDLGFWIPIVLRIGEEVVVL